MFMDEGILILRLIVGLFFIGHGTQKLFGWFGGPGLTGMAGWLGTMGMRPRMVWALMAGLSEAVGGLLLLTGFLNPLGTLGITGAMLVAMATVHRGKLWSQEGGIELPLVYLTVANVIALVGPGTYSLDALLGAFLPMPLAWVRGLVAVVGGVALALGTAERPPQTLATLPEGEAQEAAESDQKAAPRKAA